MQPGLQRKSRRNREAILRNWSEKPGFFAPVGKKKRPNSPSEKFLIPNSSSLDNLIFLCYTPQYDKR
jgi:hypothetical protein